MCTPAFEVDTRSDVLRLTQEIKKQEMLEILSRPVSICEERKS